ncbi:MAG: hypothetical protein V1722_04570 [Candidatus Micrarchaeota archaeon]
MGINVEHLKTIARVVHENFGGVTGVGVVNKTNRLTGTPKTLLVLHTEVPGGPQHVINTHIGQLLEPYGFQVKLWPEITAERMRIVVAKGRHAITITSQPTSKSRAGAIMIHQIGMS